MNKLRRKALQAILDQLDDLKSQLEEIAEEEQEARDNIPESMWETERYQKADEACDNLDYASSSLDELVEYIESAMD